MARDAPPTGRGQRRIPAAEPPLVLLVDRARAANPRLFDDGAYGWDMAGMGFVGLLGIVVLLLAAEALVKYLFFNRRR